MLDILVIKTIKICSLQVYILKTVTFYRATRMIFESVHGKAEESHHWEEWRQQLPNTVPPMLNQKKKKPTLGSNKNNTLTTRAMLNEARILVRLNCGI